MCRRVCFDCSPTTKLEDQGLERNNKCRTSPEEQICLDALESSNIVMTLRSRFLPSAQSMNSAKFIDNVCHCTPASLVTWRILANPMSMQKRVVGAHANSQCLLGSIGADTGFKKHCGWLPVPRTRESLKGQLPLFPLGFVESTKTNLSHQSFS